MAGDTPSSWWDVLWLVNPSTAILSVVTGWSTWFTGLVGFLGGASASLFWTLVGRHLLCWLQWFFCWLLKVLYSQCLPAFGMALKWMPAVPPLVVDPMLQSWRIVNYWAPLNECVAGVCIVFLVIWVFRWFRFIKQFFPTASN
jgi:hypothetical protein